MVKLNALSLLAAALLAGCTKPNNATCADDYCQDETLPFCDKDGFLEGTENACIAISCTPSELVACHTATEAYYCNATGNDINISPCANGCDEAMGGCIDEIIVEEACIANTVECDGDVVKRCNADGVLSVEACDVSCVSDPEPHCAYLEPKYLPDICDMPATGHVDFGPFDTNIDSQCTGGIVTQVDGPEICVVRAATISIPTGVIAKVTGARALALVADSSLLLEGELDISADARSSGPGGAVPEWTVGEGTGSGGGGGGGLGGRGGNGASSTVDGGAMNGGPAYDPQSVITFLAGTGRRQDPGVQAAPGGGGGGAILVACRGPVVVSGIVDAGGGGGLGGRDRDGRPSVDNIVGGGGGGSGGHLVVQGMGVSTLGQFFANGGSGGNGWFSEGLTTGNVTPGQDGLDGVRSQASVTSPVPASVQGRGGAGGSAMASPGHGTRGGSQLPTAGGPAGGGGSVGIFQVYTPAGVTPALNVTVASPEFAPPLFVNVR